MALPWCDMKIAFPCTNPDRLWKAAENGKAVFPSNWELIETDESGARCVAIFRVRLTGESLVIQGHEVKNLIRRWGR